MFVILPFTRLLQKIIMKTLLNRIFLCYLILESISGYTQNLAIGEWRIEVPYTSAKNVANGKDEVYCAMNIFYAGYVKQGFFVQKYETLNGLNDVEVSGVYYNEANDILLIAYLNSNIDIIKNNTIINIPDIERSNIATNKTIFDVYFQDSMAYISCGFGIVVLNLNREEVKETYFIGENGNQTEVFATTIYDNELFAATALGVQKASLSAANLANYQNWQLQTNNIPDSLCSDIASFNNDVLAVINDSIYKYEGGTWNYLYNDTDAVIENITVSNNRILICERIPLDGGGAKSKITSYSNGVFATLVDEGLSYIQDAVMINDSIFYVADFFRGFLKITGNKVEDINPNSIGSNSVSDVAFTEGGFAWIATGSTRNDDFFNQRGLPRAQNGNWYNLNQFNTPILQNFANLLVLEKNPNNGHLMVGSYFSGVLELDATGNFIDSFTINNSTMENRIGNPRCLIGDIAFDVSGNMWVTNFGSNNCLHVRKPDGTWKAFKPNNTPESNLLEKIVIDDNNQIWMSNTGTASQGMLVFNYGNDIDDKTDDASIILYKGEKVGNLPSNNVLCLAKDKEGEIWVGTDNGLVVFYCPGSVLSEGGCDASEILVTNPDGFVGALLDAERVQAIEVDGANRKWVGTANGLWLFSPDGTQTIYNFTTENSPLLSNNIVSLKIDPSSGVLYVGTNQGLQLYRTDATEGNETIECKNLVFPNPVRENYYGSIAITCLPANSDIKITDISGNLVHATTAFGGQAVWDGKDNDGQYIRSGVYLVFSSNEDGTSKQVNKILVMR